MGVSTEEILLRLGFDSTAVTRGTMAMLDQQKKASLDYVGFWEAALDKQAAAETKANEASLAKLKANMEAKAAVTAKFFEEQAAGYAIAQGSIPVSLGGAGAAGERQVAGRVEGDLEAGAAGALGGGMARASVFRETAVIIREFFRRNWSRMIGSVSLLAQYAGVTAATIATSIPVLGAGAAGIYSAVRQRRGLNEMQGAYGTDKTAGETTEKISKRLGIEIDKLEAAGKISQRTADDLKLFLSSGHYRIVQERLKPLLPQGYATKLPTIAEQIKDADKVAATEQKQLDAMLAKKRDEKTLADQIAEKTEMIGYQTRAMNAYDKDSLEYHKAKADLLGMEVDLQKDITQQQQVQKDLAEKQKEWEEWSQHAARDYMKDKIHDAMDEREYPTLENLAGRGFTERLNRQYGKGGRFDLGRGDGPMGDTARDYELAQKQQMWDLTYGNNDTAEKDRQRAIGDRDKLVAAGVANPEQVIGKIGEDTAKLRDLFYKLEASGALKVNIEGVAQ
jgi:hypothetical protein